MGTRVCRKCLQEKPMVDFQKHNSGRRHLCHSCRNVQRMRWEINLDKKGAARLAANKRKADLRYAERKIRERAKKHRERHETLKALVTTMYNEGFTQKELAKASNVSANTLRRIESEGPLRKGITEPVEQRLTEFFLSRRSRSNN